MDFHNHIKESATITEINSSDDENYEDAMPTPLPNQYDNEKIINELIDEHKNLLIEDKSLADNKSNDEKIDCSEKDDKFSDCETISDTDKQEDFVDDESQRDSEKDLNEEEILANKIRAEEFKNNGNVAFRDGDYENSVKIYTQGLRVCPVVCANERSILYGNRAAAKAKIGAIESAIQDCSKSLEFNPKYVKILIRFVYFHLCNYKYDYEINILFCNFQTGQTL